MSKKECIFLLPKLNTSGGNTEIMYLKKNLFENGIKIKVIPLFGSEKHEIKGVFNHLKHWHQIIKNSHNYKSILLGHYTTLFFSILLNRKVQKTIFVQSLEWKVISKNIYLQKISKLLHFICLMGVKNFIFANNILKEEYEKDFLISKIFQQKFKNKVIYPVGHKIFSELPVKSHRDIDIFLILRNNWVKRYELYLDTLYFLLNKDTKFNLRIINLSSNIIPKWIQNFQNVEISGAVSHEQLFMIYQKSKIFLYLSFYEGFGLPPLEAMSQGCIPIITNNMGCTNYIDSYSDLVLKTNSIPKNIVKKIETILNEKDYEKNLRKKNIKEFADNYYKFAEEKRKEQFKNIIKFF